MSFDLLCQCGSHLPYTDCCGLYHSGAQIPATAEALMRSRFSAFALQNADYLLQTWDASTRPASLDLSDDTTVWRKLEIIKTLKGGVNDSSAKVEFKAHYALQGQSHRQHELSRFQKRQARWFYVDGIIKASTDTEPSKNAACTCGSGKKYKRCCGAV